ncbi:hypothetical protein V8E52_003995 [Russula decolorans]
MVVYREFMRRGILPNPCHGTRHWLPSEREGGKRFRRTDSFPGGGALCLRLDPGRFWTESIYGSAWFKNAQGCMTREGYPKTVSEHRQAAVSTPPSTSPNAPTYPTVLPPTSLSALSAEHAHSTSHIPKYRRDLAQHQATACSLYVLFHRLSVLQQSIRAEPNCRVIDTPTRTNIGTCTNPNKHLFPPASVINDTARVPVAQKQKKMRTRRFLPIRLDRDR